MPSPLPSRGRALSLVAALVCGLVACRDAGVPASKPGAGRSPGPGTAWVEIAGEPFELELALDAATRQRGLSGRTHIPRNGGMLFVNPRPQVSAMVMRDCPVPIDVAFLDASGRVVAVAAMQPEPPRRPGERPFQYESRLRPYPSGEPALFAIETAGGRLAELGLVPGDRVVLPARELAARAR